MNNLTYIGNIAQIKGKDNVLEIISAEYSHIKFLVKPSFLFIENQATLVPYAISNASTTNNIVKIKLKDTDKTETYRLKKLRAFLPSAEVKLENNNPDIIGYTVFCSNKDPLGKITHIQKSSKQVIVFVEMGNATELPLPYSQITTIDHLNKKAYVSLPDDFVQIFSTAISKPKSTP
jgi:ribosomal 30S subunit maturation factor RimM